jgi:hypothetical protein
MAINSNSIASRPKDYLSKVNVLQKYEKDQKKFVIFRRLGSQIFWEESSKLEFSIRRKQTYS